MDSIEGHTPIPWRVEEGTILIWADCRPDDQTTYGMGYPVAECRVRLGHGAEHNRSFRHDEAESNAALIVRAVNGHKALVSALKTAADALHPIQDTESYPGEAREVREKARTEVMNALRLAGEEQS